MIHLDLTPDERDDFRDVIENVLTELRMEIAHTDNRDFRDQLKQRQAVLAKVLLAVEQASAQPVEHLAH